MNERIKELASQVLDELVPETWTALKYDKIKEIQFRTAELIVRECVDRVTSKANGWGDMTGFAIKESILDCAKDLKQHFGVEE
jgi:hypothetical protein